MKERNNSPCVAPLLPVGDEEPPKERRFGSRSSTGSRGPGRAERAADFHGTAQGGHLRGPGPMTVRAIRFRTRRCGFRSGDSPGFNLEPPGSGKGRARRGPAVGDSIREINDPHPVILGPVRPVVIPLRSAGCVTPPGSSTTSDRGRRTAAHNHQARRHHSGAMFEAASHVIVSMSRPSRVTKVPPGSHPSLR